MPASQAGRRGFESHRPLHFSAVSREDGLISAAELIFLFFLTLAVSPLSAQVSPDPYQPFREGEVLNFSGVDQYLGDLPPDIQRFSENREYHNLNGSGAGLPGWNLNNPQNHPGIGAFSTSSGLFFEDIANPFGMTPFLSNFPGGWTADWFDLPSEAWLGPEGAAGAVVVRDLTTQDETHLKYSGGIAGNISENGFFEMDAKNYSFSLSARQTNSNGISSSDPSYGLEASAVPYQDDFWQLSLLGLALQESSTLNWAVLSPKLTWTDGEWLTATLKPYWAFSTDGDQSVQEGGGRLRGKIDLAEMIQSQWGMGLDFQNWSLSGISSQVSKGYVQNSEWIDLIGVLTAHGSFRFDFSNEVPTEFSWVSGVKFVQDDWNIFLEGSKSVQPNGDLLEAEGGVGFQNDNRWRLRFGYLHLALPSGNQDGGRGQGEFLVPLPRVLGISSFETQWTIECLEDSAGNWDYDFGSEMRLNFSDRSSVWVLLRKTLGMNLAGEWGAEWRWKPYLGLYAYVSQSPTGNVSWPDSGFSSPTIVGLGLRGEL